MTAGTAVYRRPPDRGGGSPSSRAAPILIVDDNAAKRLALKAVLSPLDYTIVEADSGAAGLRRLMDNDFAVILLDVRMPVMDGFETAALIRMRAQSELTPIIFITAYSADELSEDRYAAGAVDFITSPVDPGELRAKVSVLAKIYLDSQAHAARSRELQETADELRLLTESAPIGIFQTDARQRYTYTNARWSEITGIPGDEAVGMPWQSIVDGEQHAATVSEFHDRFVVGEEFSSRITVQSRGGYPRLGVMTSRAVLDVDGRLTGWVGTLADVTAESEAASAMVEARDHANEASRLKSDFLANMSHELRTPMSGVIGWTELLLETDLDTHQRGFVTSLNRSGQALMNVINGVLDFSKIERGRLDMEEIDFSLRSVVDDLVDQLGRSATAKGLELTVEIDDSVPAVVSGDPNRLRQVLTNLTSNAVKFTEEGSIVIRVRAETTAGSDTVVSFEVSDTGAGIEPDKLAMIFEPFTQADTSITRQYGGTGLGLTISSRLTELMGGHVGVTSELGVGSTFSFTIGVHPRDDPDEATSEASVRDHYGEAG